LATPGSTGRARRCLALDSPGRFGTRGVLMQLLVFLFAWSVAIAAVIYLAWRKRDR
jgi:hypothetical protein